MNIKYAYAEAREIRTKFNSRNVPARGVPRSLPQLGEMEGRDGGFQGVGTLRK